MKKLITVCSIILILILFLLTSFSNGYVRLFTQINLNNVNGIHVESTNMEKYKKVTRIKDITPILKFINSLRFKETDSVEVLNNNKDKSDAFKINYRVNVSEKVIIGKGNPPEICINILNDRTVYFMGKYYFVNKEMQKYVAKIYKNLKYIECETVPRIHSVK